MRVLRPLVATALCAATACGSVQANSDAATGGDPDAAVAGGPDAPQGDPDAEVPIRPDAGNPSDCAVPLPCPAPDDPNASSVCGRVWDVETSQPVDDGDVSSGIPYMELLVHALDPYELVSGGGVTPLASAALDPCGRFVLTDLPVSSFGVVVIATDDAADDDHVLTGVLASGPGVHEDFPAWTTRRATDEQWSTTAPLPPGDTFGALGAIVVIFTEPSPADAPPLGGLPVAGMTITLSGQPAPDVDYYFGDDAPAPRHSIDPALAATSATGSGLVTGVSLQSLSGTGWGAGCSWPSSLASSAPGAILVMNLRAECP